MSDSVQNDFSTQEIPGEVVSQRPDTVNSLSTDSVVKRARHLNEQDRAANSFVPISGLDDANLALQVPPTHACRMQRYIRDIFGDENAQFIARGLTDGGNRFSERLLFYQCKNPMTVLEILRDDPHACYCLRRIYRIQGWRKTISDAIDASLKVACDLGLGPPVGQEVQTCRKCNEDGKILARYQAYPPKCLKTLLDTYSNVEGLHLCAQGYTCLINILCTHGVVYFGVDHATSFIGKMSIKNVQTGVKSRAFYKLREALVRGHLVDAQELAKIDYTCAASQTWKVLPAATKCQRRFAIDVGAAPGGWSQFLAERLHFKHVFAVDPGDLTPPIHTDIQHIPARIQSAYAILEETMQESLLDNVMKNETVSRRLDAYVCDMNVPPAISFLLFLDVLPLLSDNAWLVITFKNFCGTVRKWHDQMDTCRSLAREYLCIPETVEMTHLLCNGPREKTLTAVLRPEAFKNLAKCKEILELTQIRQDEKTSSPKTSDSVQN